MKYLRFLTEDNKIRFGRLDTNDETCPIWLTDDCFNTSDERFDLKTIRILPPTAVSNIITLDNNIVFNTTPRAVLSMYDAVPKAPDGEALCCGGNLALIVGKQCKNISAKNADEYIFGFTCCLSVAIWDPEAKKERTGSEVRCAVGPYAETEFNNFSTETFINGKLTQTCAVECFPQELLSAISHERTLEKGDIILIGARKYAGPLSRGDVIQVKTEGVGTLVNIMK